MRYPIVVEKAENNYSVCVPDLPDCSGQVFSDTKIGCSSAIFRSKTLGDR